MKLKRLLKDIPVTSIRGSQEVEITGLSSDSRSVFPGNLFIAKKGENYQGSSFIPEAVAAGAVAVLTDLYDPFLRVSQVLHPSPGKLEPVLARRYYGAPSEELLLIGVTGTSGKTTCAYLVRHFLNPLKKCGLMGTIEWVVGDHVLPARYTTPDILTTSKLMRESLEAGSKACVMEVSSHALAQGRVEGLDYDIAVFTNLSHDHLDYHVNLEEYARTKAQLFTSLGSTPSSKKKGTKWAVVNVDSSWTSFMLKGCCASILTYAIDAPADLTAHKIEMTLKGSRFEVHYKEQRALFSTTLIGRFNIYNVLAATATALLAGMELGQIAQAIQTFPGVLGRLERVFNPLDLSIFVDYAHKPDALENVLSTLKELMMTSSGKIITVFGCGGNRDRAKRPLMAKAVEERSDVVIITSDNPRLEDPRQIIEEALQGMKEPEKAILHVDRKEAIRCALQLAKPHDIVLIAGKGHEQYQTIGQRSLPFDDREEALRICHQLASDMAWNS